LKTSYEVDLIGIREVPFPAVTVCPVVSSKWRGINEVLKKIDQNETIFATFNEMPQHFKVLWIFLNV
jgi:hypothetical protein